MAWRLHDEIILTITNLTKRELIDSLNETGSLKILDKLDAENCEVDMTFSPKHQIIFDTFNKLVRSEASYLTTIEKLKIFAKECLTNTTILDLITNDDMNLSRLSDIIDIFSDNELLKQNEIEDDTIVVIELDD